MFLVKCDTCGKEEPARQFQEAAMKPMFVEPMDWLRRFDNKDHVLAVFCSLECDKKYKKGSTLKSSQL